VADPELVILDEPFSGLDPVNMEVLRDAVLRLRDNGTTVLFSTHDMAMAEQLCDRVCMIFRGRKVLDDSLIEISKQHGVPTLRVRMAHGVAVPNSLPHVERIVDKGNYVDLCLEPDADNRIILSRLIEHGEVEHFEVVRPSLHDIFVRIAKPAEV
jgi:ABC-2 type transport system ATP-binding protein